MLKTFILETWQLTSHFQQVRIYRVADKCLNAEKSDIVISCHDLAAYKLRKQRILGFHDPSVHKWFVTCICKSLNSFLKFQEMQSCTWWWQVTILLGWSYVLAQKNQNYNWSLCEYFNCFNYFSYNNRYFLLIRHNTHLLHNTLLIGLLPNTQGTPRLLLLASMK